MASNYSLRDSVMISDYIPVGIVYCLDSSGITCMAESDTLLSDKCLCWNLFPDLLFLFTTMTITLAANNNSGEVIRVLKCS